MNWIKADTVVTLRLGPFIDNTDFITPETGLTIVQADIQISKAGAAFAQTSEASPTVAHDTDGWYSIPLTAADTDTEGLLVIQITIAGVLFVKWEGMVVPANVYNSVVLGTANLAVDTVAISGDNTAADNVEATYDGSGYTDVFAPAQQQQVDSISSGSGDISTTADSFVLTVGSEGATDYTDTLERDGVHHTITDVAGTIDAYYDILLTGADAPTSVTIFGRANGANDPITISQWNWNTTSWNVRGTLIGINQAIDTEHKFSLLGALIGTGADIGKVRIRISGTGLTTASLNIDEFLLGYTKLGESAGYVGFIWIDTVAGVAGTVSFVNGTSDNPVDSLADALTLSAAIGLRRFHVAQNSVITFAGTMDGYFFDGIDYIIDPNGQQVDGTTIVGAVIPSGTITGNGGSLLMERCKFGNVTLPETAMLGSAFAGTITFSEIGTYFADRCASAIAGNASPTFDFGAAVGTTAFNLRHYSGGVEIENMKAGDTMSLEGAGQLIINANCTGGGIAIRGSFTVTDNAGGVVTLTEDARYDVAMLATSEDMDEIKGGTFNTLTDSLETLSDAIAAIDVGVGSGDTEVDQDSGVGEELWYKTAGDVAIQDAVIRVYVKAQYDAGIYSVVATTTTTATGAWKDVLLLNAGIPYYINFYKAPPNGYGPDVVEFTP